MVIFEHLAAWIKLLVGESAIAAIVAFFLVWVVLWLPIAVPLAIALKWQPPKPLAVEQKLPLVLSLYALAPLVLWGATAIQEIPFSVYGLTWQIPWLVSLMVGLGLGILGIALMVGLERGLGWATWQQPSGQQISSILPATLLIGLLVSIIEELIFRGFLLNQLQTEFSPWIAAAGSSLIFALLHLVWEGAEAAPQLPGLWLMGVVLVMARWADGGSLGLACGLHAGWIWGMASLDSAQAVRMSDRAPTWITGLAGKPLAGVMGLLLLLVTALALLSIPLLFQP